MANRKRTRYSTKNVEYSSFILIDPFLKYVFKRCIDPAFGSSNYGLTIIQFSNRRLEVAYADELARPSHDEVRNFLFYK